MEKQYKNMKKIISSVLATTLFTALFVGFATLATACGKEEKTILGSGASFPYPVYSKMFEDYLEKTGVRVNYQSIGSGGGIRQLLAQTAEFGATDAFMDDEELQQSENEILHIPIVLGGIAIAYNLSEKIELRLDGDTLAKIFMRDIEKWNDPQISALNQGVALPDKEIIVIRRSDGSGTTFGFSDFLAFSSEKWKNSYGVSKSIKWARDTIGAKGNEGVSGQLKNTDGSIGYINLNYAKTLDIPLAAIKNGSGKFVKPTIESISLAAQKDIPDDTRIRLSASSTLDNGYPISSFTWIIVYKEQAYNNRTKEQAKRLYDLLSWMVTEGQQHAQPLYYSPLPKKISGKVLEVLDTMTYNKESL